MKVVQTIYCLWAEWLDRPAGHYDTLEAAKKSALEIYHEEHSNNSVVTEEDWMKHGFMYIEEIEVYSEDDE